MDEPTARVSNRCLMDTASLLQHILRRRDYGGQMVRVHNLPERKAEYGSLPDSTVDVRVSAALEAMGISGLYCHQVEAVGRTS
mgnify:CR=1 FL=1